MEDTEGEMNNKFKSKALFIIRFSFYEPHWAPFKLQASNFPKRDKSPLKISKIINFKNLKISFLKRPKSKL